MTDPRTPANDTSSGSAPKPLNPIRQGIDTARETATGALKSARETAADAARRTADGIEGNPLSVLVGGIAVGVLAGTLLPRTERETDLLGPMGKKITEGAAAAARAARDAGKAELMEAGISSEAARAQLDKLIHSVMDAIKSAGDAAAKAAKPQ